jgi:uncharacterized protein (TIGR02145 family)
MLRGGLPLGGAYSGVGVQGLQFNPAIIPGALTSTTITYTYTNVYNCIDSSNQVIVVYPGNSLFQCGQTFEDVRDNQTYATQQIGTQCWMKQNLNYGVTINSTQLQEDNCTSEKYCYSNNTGNCLVNGGLYQWDEMMQYDIAEPAQGLCPPGWHIPSETEWMVLINMMSGPGLAGDSLKVTGSSGFNAFLSGLMYQNNSWNFDDFSTFYWTSTLSGTIKAISHGLNLHSHSVSTYMSNRGNAFSIRCLKD